MLAVVVLTIATKGTSSGQTSILGSILDQYIEETSASISKAALSNNQAAFINNFLAANGQEFGRGGPETINEISPIQESSIEAFNPANEQYLDEMSNKRSSVVEYEVQTGDTLSFIASDYGVSINSIIWANKLSASAVISPGQILKIPPITGVIHEVKKGDSIQSLAQKYGAKAEEIIEFNVLPKDGNLQIGKQIVIPDGKIGTTSVASTATSTTKRFSYLPDLGSFFKIPAGGFNWGQIHGRNGVDVANSCGTPIYAAADGQVSVVDITGWNGGFGKYLKIFHPNDTETLYAHTSKILVEQGQNVTKGEQIALMGTTGRSTGCHLHFEVHGAKNPLSKF